MYFSGAFFDMYIGDVPVSEQTKVEIGKNVANLIRRCWNGLFPYSIVPLLNGAIGWWCDGLLVAGRKINLGSGGFDVLGETSCCSLGEYGGCSIKGLSGGPIGY